ncbi:MAG: glycosyltransferase family 39 protein [Candidatus Doudnabacteria bacterium]|nr:glycosyltransferase family 39 protein [Candidatus Doudnabacteria bacterium]
MWYSGRLEKIIVVFVLLLAGFLIFWRLDLADTLTDEVELAFRSVGYLDFLATPHQTALYEWFQQAPWWARMSFHDHPPLVFLLEHLTFRLFSDSVFFLRLPFALIGLGSLWALYWLANNLFNAKVALVALLLASVNTYQVWISRIGLQEGPVIFFALLSLGLFVRATKSTERELRWRDFAFWGVVTGLAFLTKYTAFVLVPLVFGYAWLVVPGVLRNKKFYAGLALALAVFSPVLLYNLFLYFAVGHFDLQFATLFGQQTPEWSGQLGKQIGSIGQRLVSFYPNFWHNASPGFVAGYLAVLSGTGYWFLKKSQENRSRLKFLLFSLFTIHLLILLIGPSQRFLALLVPFAILTLAYGIVQFFDSPRAVLRRAGYILFSLLLAYETFLCYQTNLAISAPRFPWSFSMLRYESSSWGYNELERYLVELLDHNRPAVSVALPERLAFIQAVRENDFRKIQNKPVLAALIVYDPRINNLAKLWIYDRRYYYDGWPFVSIDEYLEVERLAPGYFARLNFTDYYYVAASDHLFTGGNSGVSGAAPEFQKLLQARNDQQVTNIYNRLGEPVFTIYHSPQPLNWL